MIRKDLEAAGIPYTTKDGDADFHAVGRPPSGTFSCSASVTAAMQQMISNAVTAFLIV